MMMMSAEEKESSQKFFTPLFASSPSSSPLPLSAAAFAAGLSPHLCKKVGNSPITAETATN